MDLCYEWEIEGEKMKIIEKLGITPGPWEWVYQPDMLGFDTDEIIIQSGIKELARLDPEMIEVSKEEIKPNTRLITTAPDMLEALIDIMKLNDLLWIEERAKVIVEKATGKSWEEIKVLLNE